MGDGNTDLSPEREENNADASNGIGDDKVHIFVSHKSEDKKIALEIKKQLCRYAADRIEVYCSEEIEPGDDWLTWIKTKVCKSNLLLLLFTDPSASWDWCLFEAGLFLDLTGDKFKRVVCLHHPNTDPPKPLMNLQTLPAEEELLIEFLKLFYGGTELMGLNTVINEVHANDEDEINRQAKKIIKLFAPANYSRWYPLRRLVLSLPKSNLVKELKDTKTIPDGAAVDEPTGYMLADVFGLLPTEDGRTWEELKQQSEKRGDTYWIDELGQAMAAAEERTSSIRLTQTFRAAKGGMIFRPVLYRVDFDDKTPFRYHVLFNEETTPANVAGEGALDQLFNLLRMCHRFRKEVLGSYKGKLAVLSGESSPGIICDRLKDVIEIIEYESRALGFLDKDKLQTFFDKNSDKEKIAEFLRNWDEENRAPFIDALEARDLVMIEGFLEQFEIMNRDFMAFCSKHYARLVEQDYRDVASDINAADPGGVAGSG